MELTVIAVFIFCAALAAGSILLASRLIKEYDVALLRSLFYHIIFIMAFGFYGIWGQFIIISVGGAKLTPAVLSAISVISLLLGMPFLVFGWLMLIRFSSECSGYRFSNWTVVGFLFISFGILFAIAYAVRDLEYSSAITVFRYYYSASSLLFALIASWLLLAGSPGPVTAGDRKAAAAIFTAGAAAQAAVLLFLPTSALMAMAFVFLLFATATLPSVYFSYRADLSSLSGRKEEAGLPETADDFFSRHEISPREAEIIREICNGLSNQEIADRLFITLQTVKDHTSRIYYKTNVRNRMQLMNLVRGINRQEEQSSTAGKAAGR